MSISLGSTSISNAYLGSSAASAIYLGSTQVWTSGPPLGIFIGGLASTLDQAGLEAKLTGETLIDYSEVGSDIFVSSSTNYSLNTSAFESNSSITAFIDGGKCTSIGVAAFKFSSVVNVNCPNATVVGSSAFYFANALESIQVPAATVIAGYAFRACYTLTSVTMSNVQSIQDFAFRGCTAMNAIEAPNLISIGNNAFQQCSSVTTVDIPTVTSIGSSAFIYSSGLQTAAFTGATTVGAAAFSGCTSLDTIYLNGLVGDTALGGSDGDTTVFANVASGGQITVPTYYQTNNAGGLDGDLAYLQNTKGWTINWV